MSMVNHPIFANKNMYNEEIAREASLSPVELEERATREASFLNGTKYFNHVSNIVVHKVLRPNAVSAHS